MVPTEINAWAAKEAKQPLTRVSKTIGALKDHEVLVQVKSCGVCHSDLHLIDNDWGMSSYPQVAGHEIIGTIVSAGKDSPIKVGTTIGIGWQRGACLECDECVTARDNMCSSNTATCVAHWGGYADYHVSDSRFCFPLPKVMEEPRFAPLFCGGATVFSPLCQFLDSSLTRVPRVGVVALGGLGHLAVKFAKGMGADVTLFSSNPKKAAQASSLNVDNFVSSVDASEIERSGRKLDLIIVTANVDLPWASYLKTLRADGTLCFVGIPPSPMTLPVFELMGKRLRVAASPIASRGEIARMIEFAARNDISADVELFAMDKANEALTRVREGAVRHRAVLVNS